MTEVALQACCRAHSRGTPPHLEGSLSKGASLLHFLLPCSSLFLQGQLAPFLLELCIRCRFLSPVRLADHGEQLLLAAHAAFCQRNCSNATEPVLVIQYELFHCVMLSACQQSMFMDTVHDVRTV
jgi:hypothetical protein